jgi:uncharacterized protein RhaS with RHS repeats
MQYMRNRYYDPSTGRFTQQDPIGLAGGMNLYGFASGDPVNFSDPMGLCPIVGLAMGPVVGGATALWCLAETATIATAAFSASRIASKSRTTSIAATRTGERDGGATVRLQAQGTGLEESVVIQAGASGRITAADALAGLAELKAGLSASELAARADAFGKAERFILGAAAGGGYLGAGQSFAGKGGVRVDVEVRRANSPVFQAGGRSDALIVP